MMCFRLIEGNDDAQYRRHHSWCNCFRSSFKQGVANNEAMTAARERHWLSDQTAVNVQPGYMYVPGWVRMVCAIGSPDRATTRNSPV